MNPDCQTGAVVAVIVEVIVEVVALALRVTPSCCDVDGV